MNRFAAIYQRELRWYFHSPVAYAVIAAFVWVSGYFFYNLLAYFNMTAIQAMQNPIHEMSLNLTHSVVQPYFSDLTLILLLLVVPALTMRQLAEERRSGSAELLFTFPVSHWHVVLGKYAAAVTMYSVMLILTIIFPAILVHYATPDPGPLSTGYVGLLMMGVAFIAMGMFFSATATSQMVAGMLSASFGLVFLLVAWLEPFVSAPTAAVIGQLSILGHFDSFARGVIDTNDIIYYVNVAVFFIFLCARVVDSQRWRG